MGTSHGIYGISPLEIYQEQGISSYNLSTSAQRIQIAYYLLKEAFKVQKPKVVALDVSELFQDNVQELAWRYGKGE